MTFDRVKWRSMKPTHIGTAHDDDNDALDNEFNSCLYSVLVQVWLTSGNSKEYFRKTGSVDILHLRNKLEI